MNDGASELGGGVVESVLCVSIKMVRKRKRIIYFHREKKIILK